MTSALKRGRPYAAKRPKWATSPIPRPGALKTNRTYNLGVLYEDPQHSGLGHEYFSRILESFRAQAEACGYDVTFINRNVGKRALVLPGSTAATAAWTAYVWYA